MKIHENIACFKRFSRGGSRAGGAERGTLAAAFRQANIMRGAH